jgi:hypothetical protein
MAAELYAPASNRFAADTPMMNEGRIEATATLILFASSAGKVLVAAGLAGSPASSTELYDPATDTFSAGPEMSDERGSHTATVIASGKRLVGF